MNARPRSSLRARLLLLALVPLLGLLAATAIVVLRMQNDVLECLTVEQLTTLSVDLADVASSLADERDASVLRASGAEFGPPVDASREAVDAASVDWAVSRDVSSSATKSAKGSTVSHTRSSAPSISVSRRSRIASWMLPCSVSIRSVNSSMALRRWRGRTVAP